MTINYPAFYADMIRAPHVLIAGTTGSGKTEALKGLLYALAARDPARVSWVLIDPKRVELAAFRDFPHTAAYAANYADIARTIAAAHAEMMRRYDEMARAGATRWAGSEMFVIIDEWVDIKQYCPRETVAHINHIASLARSAGVHLVICTQRPTKDCLSPLLKDNLPCKLALATESPQQSKYLVNSPAAYGLPIGTGLFYTPARPGEWQRVKIDMISPEKWQAIRDIRTPPKPRHNSILSRISALWQ